LRDVGFVEGKSITIEYRLAENYELLPALAAELVDRKVALVYAAATSAAIAAKAATATIPLVFFVGKDPIKDGLVASYNHPGGNATGVTAVRSGWRESVSAVGKSKRAVQNLRKPCWRRPRDHG
jgi:putative tryptophan/tyrosine transport system substrate-binding protein